jgi:hypothetical protein
VPVQSTLPSASEAQKFTDALIGSYIGQFGSGIQSLNAILDAIEDLSPSDAPRGKPPLGRLGCAIWEVCKSLKRRGADTRTLKPDNFQRLLTLTQKLPVEQQEIVVPRLLIVGGVFTAKGIHAQEIDALIKAQAETQAPELRSGWWKRLGQAVEDDHEITHCRQLAQTLSPAASAALLTGILGCELLSEPESNYRIASQRLNVVLACHSTFKIATQQSRQTAAIAEELQLLDVLTRTAPRWESLVQAPWEQKKLADFGQELLESLVERAPLESRDCEIIGNCHPLLRAADGQPPDSRLSFIAKVREQIQRSSPECQLKMTNALVEFQLPTAQKLDHLEATVHWIQALVKAHQRKLKGEDMSRIVFALKSALSNLAPPASQMAQEFESRRQVLLKEIDTLDRQNKSWWSSLRNHTR